MLTLSLLLVLGAAPKAHVSLGKVTASEGKAAVTRELQTHVEPLEGCYDLAAKATPGLNGALSLTFTVEPEAGLTSITASEDSLKDETLVPCVMARLRRGSWPVKKKPLTVTATLKFK
jgi:hypothetical protein